MKKETTKILVIALVVAIIAFYAGMKYSPTTKNYSNTQRMMGAYGQISATGGTQGAKGMRNGFGGLVSGTVLSKDNTGITITLRQGGSTNILISGNTLVQKSVSGALSDVSIGQDVIVTGTANADGSVTAQSIQIRPASTTPAK